MNYLKNSIQHKSTLQKTKSFLIKVTLFVLLISISSCSSSDDDSGIVSVLTSRDADTNISQPDFTNATGALNLRLTTTIRI